MNIIVTLEELEKELKVKYPKTFHEIYETGAMGYLKHTCEWLKENRQDVSSNVESFFYAVGGDCEVILFPEISSYIGDFEEMLRYDEDYELGKVIINPNYRFIPFAHMASGDLYCFWYDGIGEEPKITLYGHDTGDMELWANNFDEFLFIQLGSSIIDWDKEFEDPSIQAHLKFLKDEYKLHFQNADIENIKKDIENLGELNQVEFLVTK